MYIFTGTWANAIEWAPAEKTSLRKSFRRRSGVDSPLLARRYLSRNAKGKPLRTEEIPVEIAPEPAQKSTPNLDAKTHSFFESTILHCP